MDNKILKQLICTLFIGLVITLPVSAKDPTRPALPAMTKAKSKTSMSKTVEQPLTAIFIKNKKRLAMIEGKIYQVGEYYGDSRILNIYRDKVLLSSGQGKFHLTLIPNIKK